MEKSSGTPRHHATPSITLNLIIFLPSGTTMHESGGNQKSSC